MFAKKARSLNFSRDLGLRRNAAAVRPCNDNQPVRLVAPWRRKRRPVLFCRWRVTPAGQIECSWHDGSAPAAEEPWISWSRAALRRSNRAALARRRGQRGRKTTQCRQSTRSALTDSTRLIQSTAFRCAGLVDRPKGNPVRLALQSNPELPPQLSAASYFPNVPLGFAEQSLGRRTTVTTRKPGDLPERRHPSATRGARAGRASAMMTERIVTR
jgi:hypothetical protein